MSPRYKGGVVPPDAVVAAADAERRRIERELDLEEEGLAFKRASEPDPPL